jgi:aryl sulfotransferase
VRHHDFVTDSARWDGFPLRGDDIIISTPPKCGTTWTQRLCSLLLGVEPTVDRPLAVISPWLDMLTRPLGEVMADLEAQEHRRFIKTHTPLDGLPWDDRVTYLVVGRDPRDVAFSWDHHMANLDMDRFIGVRIGAVGADDLAEIMPDGPPGPPSDDPQERFAAWVGAEGMVSGLAGLHAHLAGFWAVRDRPNVHLFHYSDMKADLPGTVRRLAAVLEVPVDDADVDRIAAAAGFERMRADADLVVPNRDVGIWKDDASFFRQGRGGEWREVLDDAHLEVYRARIEGLTAGDDELLRWLHEGERSAVG